MVCSVQLHEVGARLEKVKQFVTDAGNDAVVTCSEIRQLDFRSDDVCHFLLRGNFTEIILYG